jgi:arylsulfatase A-like enzyme/Flp pilus assembly protein TadD
MARKRSRKRRPPTEPPPSFAPTRGRRWRWILLGGVVAAALLASIALYWPRRGVEVRREPGLNVLLVTVDTLRADALGAYGHPEAPAPWIDRLAEGGVLFERAYAHNVVTLPSHANILSGRYPLDHGVRDNSGFRFPDKLDTLATLLQERGYRTGAFVSAFPLDSQFGLARGFDVYEDSFVNVDTNPAFLVQERSGKETVALARRWIEAGTDEPFFCWVHVFEPHFPYAPPPSLAARFPSQPYLGEVAAADAALAPLLQPLVEAGPEGRTVVVFTADHGEGLGQHGEKTHGLFAYEGTLHIPLILFAPRLLAPRVVAEPVRHVDLLPTVLDILGSSPPAELPGRSLLPLAEGLATPTPPSYFEALSANLNRGWAPLHGVVRDRLKFIDLPIPELYDLAHDPGENRNLAASEPETVEAMREVLASFGGREKVVRRTEETDETRERLEALGYLTSGAGPTRDHYTEADDPKNLIGLDSMLHDVAGLHARGDLDGALALCRELLRRRPDMPLALSRLAFLLREKGDLPGAVDALRKAFALDPSDMDTLAVLAAYLNEAGRESETLDLVEPYVGRNQPDLDVLVAYGVGLAQAGRFRDALAAFARARELDPSNAMVLVDTATVHMMMGNNARARDALRAALELNPNLARAHNSLGVIAAREGRPTDAIDHWKTAVELDPREFDTLFNLGSSLIESGRTDEARPYLERFAREAPRALYASDIAHVRAWLEDGARPTH